MTDREFFIDQDGFKLHAKWNFPKKEQEKYPVVILVPGLTGHMEEPHIIGVSEAVTACDMACLRVELYGHGKSDGAFRDHNVMEWVMELIRVIDYARSQDFAEDIILSGHSQGGLATILAAGLKADQLKAIMPLSPATNIRDACREGNFFGYAFDENSIPEELDFWEEWTVSGNYIRVARILPIEQMIDAYKGPALIIHGTEDESVPYECGVKASDAYENGRLVTIEGDTHCYDRSLDKVQSAVQEFLRSLSN